MPTAACAWGGLVASRSLSALWESWPVPRCPSISGHPSNLDHTPALSLRGGPGEGTCWVSQHHPAVPRGYSWARGHHCVTAAQDSDPTQPALGDL